MPLTGSATARTLLSVFRRRRVARQHAPYRGARSRRRRRRARRQQPGARAAAAPPDLYSSSACVILLIASRPCCCYCCWPSQKHHPSHISSIRQPVPLGFPLNYYPRVITVPERRHIQVGGAIMQYRYIAMIFIVGPPGLVGAALHRYCTCAWKLHFCKPIPVIIRVCVNAVQLISVQLNNYTHGTAVLLLSVCMS